MIGSHIKANNIASSDRFLSVCVPVATAIDDLQRLIFIGALTLRSRTC
jgi:hypothetical protein